MAKENNLVVYKNEFNTVPLRSFNGTEMDLLMAIMSQMKDKGLTEVEFSFEKLKELSKYNRTNALDPFIDDLKSTYNKLISLNVCFENDKKFVSFVLFTKYEVDKEEQTVKVRVNEEFKDLINQMTGNFTRFELEQFTGLRSSYSKTAYRLLKQYWNTGVARFGIEDFKRLFDVPPSYQICHITDAILKPIERELGDIFYNLEIVKHKKKRRVVGIEFKWNTQREAEEWFYKGKKPSTSNWGFIEREYEDGELSRLKEGNWRKKDEEKDEDREIKPDEIEEFCKRNQVGLLDGGDDDDDLPL